MSRMALSGVVKGKLTKPVRVLIHGTEGVGKSTFAADAPSPIFLCSEDGTSQLDIERFPEPQTWSDVLDAALTLAMDEHQYKTLVIDTLDWLEPLCWAHVCREGKVSSIEDFGWGKGFNVAMEQWRILAARLDALRAKRGMHVVLIAHSWIRPFSNPEGENFDRYELKLHKLAAGMFKEWVDAVLFATWDAGTVKRSSQKDSKSRGISTGARIMRTERRAAFDAKNRYGLDFQMPLSWTEFWAGVEHGQDAEASRMAADALALAIGTQHEKTVRDGLARAGVDATKLAKVLDWTRAKLAQMEVKHAS